MTARPALPAPQAPAAASAPIFAAIAIGHIDASRTNPRKTFSETAHQELTESVRAMGILQPVLVRPHPSTAGHFEIIAGERRYRAAKAAGLTEIPALVRNMSDLDVLEAQVVENLQRSDLHPLEEAEGYEALINAHGYNADRLAAKVGKSRSYIYGRLKFTALSDAARKAFYDGDIDASVALLLARIPNDALQAEALQSIVDPAHYDEPLSYRQAKDLVHGSYMLHLADAPFDITDTTLVQHAGPCTTCPKRTGAQPELFADVHHKDVCTDTTCFGEKRAAHGDRVINQAKAEGRYVIEGKTAKKLMPYPHSGFWNSGYTKLDERCQADQPKMRTLRELLKDEKFNITLFRNPHDDSIIELVDTKVVDALDRRLRRANDTKQGAVAGKGVLKGREVDANRATNNAIAAAAIPALTEAVRTRGCTVDDLRDLLQVAIALAWGPQPLHDALCKRHKLDECGMSGVPDAALPELTIELLAVEAAQLPEAMAALCARHGVDYAALKKTVAATMAAEAKPAKAKAKSGKPAAPAKAPKVAAGTIAEPTAKAKRAKTGAAST
jgi:ParB/RepB/Spo0J family partition protein